LRFPVPWFGWRTTAGSSAIRCISFAGRGRRLQFRQGDVSGPGELGVALHYFFEAGKLLAGLPALALGAAGVVAALARRVFWPVLLLLLPPVFYVWSIHSASTPIFIPTLWPNSFTTHDTRWRSCPLWRLEWGP